MPTALVTATLSGDELSLHAKLRQHADLYLDMRLLTKEILVRALAPFAPDLISLPDANSAATSTEFGEAVGLRGTRRFARF